MALNGGIRRRLSKLLEQLFGDRAHASLERIDELAARYHFTDRHGERLWSERDVVLIVYADQITKNSAVPLRALHEWLTARGLQDLFSTVHVLPFYPWSSDDGFSVVDYRQVDENVGTWEDVKRLGQDFDLMADLVLNHCSAQSAWFESYVDGTQPYTGYFVEMDPAADLSAVVRPRSLPLLTRFETSRGDKHVWTTFSADQVDLNFANPEVLLEFLDILLFYVAMGARIIRLDAIAYLWKTPGTKCIHLPETHAVAKLMRALLDALAPGTILLTETNVPHAENVSYFGAGEEAHMVYQFSLGPLLLDACLARDNRYFQEWLGTLDLQHANTTYFNFTASHDGIGLRPLESILPAERVAALASAAGAQGGRINTYADSEGHAVPYELNITWSSMLAGQTGLNPELHSRRVLSTQAVMLAMRGVPAVYIHSLVGTSNYTEGVAETGQARTINRRKFQDKELNRILDVADGVPQRIFDGYRRMLAVRIRQPAFHPDAVQRLIAAPSATVIVFERVSIDGAQRIVVVFNLLEDSQSISLGDLGLHAPARDLIAGTICERDRIELAAFQAAWLCVA